MTKDALDRLYRRFNRRRYVHPDPLEFLYAYPDLRDREIVGLIASSLAYGRVAQILSSVRRVLDRLGPSPCAFLMETSPKSLARVLAPFKHRFTTGQELAELLSGVRDAVARHGSLNRCFVAGYDDADETVLPALERFAGEIAGRRTYLLPCPAAGSACKRMNLYLRWMVRKDAVDPGGWAGVPRAKLVAPLDTHMARIGRALGFTKRKAANLGMALDITRAFRRFSPGDPVKYDFALTRFGIRGELDVEELVGTLKIVD